MSQTTAIIGISPDEIQWIRMLVALLRHSDPTLPELTRQALLYLSNSAGETAVPPPSARARQRSARRVAEF
jgi:hypothetical protein